MAHIQVVWFKRDIRLLDHQALHEAAQYGPVVCLYAYEPSQWRRTVQLPANLTFLNQSLRELDAALSDNDARMTYRVGECPQVFRQLHQELQPWGGIHTIWSHSELGNKVTEERNQRVQRWCESQEIAWQECAQHGAYLPTPEASSKKLRSNWLKHEPLPAPDFEPMPANWEGSWHYGSVQSARTFGLADEIQTLEIRGGANKARSLLRDLLDQGTKPELDVPSFDILGSLQPYLAWGNISIRQVLHALRKEQDKWQALPEALYADKVRPRIRKWLRSCQQRCLQLQNYAEHPWMEFRNRDETFDGMREHDFDSELFQDWCEGNTGYPWIDASIRHLRHTGTWTSTMFHTAIRFATHHLWLHWRKLLSFLAQHWVGYEPGLHILAVQEVAGTTGRIPIRMDCPTKLAHKYDPDGELIRTYLTELAPLPDSEIFAPHLTPVMMQHFHQCVIGTDYPQPIIPFEQAKEWVEERCKERERLHPPPQTTQPVPPPEPVEEVEQEEPPITEWATLPLESHSLYHQ